MEISKSDALFLYSVLFRTVVSDHISLGDKEDHAADLLSRFETYLADVDSQNVATMGATSDNEVVIEADATIEPSVMLDLSSVNVKTPSGESASLEFEQSLDVVNATFSDLEQEITLEDVLAIKVLYEDSCEIHLYAGDEWHTFPVKKLPKTWRSTFKSGDIYAIFSKEDEE